MGQPLSIIESMPEMDFQAYIKHFQEKDFSQNRLEALLAQVSYYICLASGNFDSSKLKIEKFMLKTHETAKKLSQNTKNHKEKRQRWGFFTGKRF